MTRWEILSVWSLIPVVETNPLETREQIWWERKRKSENGDKSTWGESDVEKYWQGEQWWEENTTGQTKAFDTHSERRNGKRSKLWGNYVGVRLWVCTGVPCSDCLSPPSYCNFRCQFQFILTWYWWWQCTKVAKVRSAVNQTVTWTSEYLAAHSIKLLFISCQFTTEVGS